MLTNHQIPGIDVIVEENYFIRSVFTAQATLGKTKSRSVEITCESAGDGDGDGSASVAFFSLSMIAMLLI